MHKLPLLPYAYDALEPYIDEKTMITHHTKHHQGYTDKLNAALEGHASLQDKSIEDLLSDTSQLPEKIKTAVINNGGGYANHNLFWESMSPDSASEPEGKLADQIKKDFGSFDKFQEEFNQAATTQFGSGWAWLSWDPKAKKLVITQTSNQDSPLSQGQTPILNLDVWEHAYYLNYQNRRPEYIEKWWNVVNWDLVAQKLDEAMIE